MRVFCAVIFVLATVHAPTARADDKGRFGLSKLNPFKKKDDPAAKSRQSADVLRTDPDEKKRKAAAEELRDTDAKLVPEVLPVLVASLRQDPSAAVRATVAESIGKLKPVSPQAGVILESVAATDPNEGVRKAAQTAVWDYRANGYQPSNAKPYVATNEPPLAKPRPIGTPAKQIVAPVTAPKPSPLGIPNGVNRGPQFGETNEPPLANRKSATVNPPRPVIPAPTLPGQAMPPPPSIAIPVPLPIPTAPTMPAPPAPMPKAPTVPGTVPAPPPSSNPNF